MRSILRRVLWCRLSTPLEFMSCDCDSRVATPQFCNCAAWLFVLVHPPDFCSTILRTKEPSGRIMANTKQPFGTQTFQKGPLGKMGRAYIPEKLAYMVVFLLLGTMYCRGLAGSFLWFLAYIMLNLQILKICSYLSFGVDSIGG